MPPTFLYLLAAVLYAAVTVVVVALGFALWCVPRTRERGRRMVAAMLASIPGVLAFQALAGPVALGVQTAVGTVGPNERVSTAHATLAVLALFTAFGALTVGSVVGAVAGWRAGWALAGGVAPSEALRAVPIYGRLVRRASHVASAG